MNQHEFESECDMILHTFLSKFSSQTYENSAKILRNIKENKNFFTSTPWRVGLDEKSYECFFK